MALSGLRVMVVEDHGFQRRMALRLLGELGIDDAREAGDGAAALEILRGLKQRHAPDAPDVLLLDLDMPGMDGVELIEHLAREALVPAVVLVSALDPALLTTVQAMSQAYGLRVVGSIEKPLTAPKLGAVLARSGEDREAAPLDEVQVSGERLRAAMAGGSFVPWYQLQVEIPNGQAVGVEALARWQRADGTVVLPAQFLKLVEREGLSAELTDTMLDQGCRALARWARAGRKLRLSVNVSPDTLADTGSADRVHRVVVGHGVDPRAVTFEVTERSMMGDAAGSLGVLARLRLKGFGLSIDDFGTGYSSLLQLSQIPFTELKIDQAFVSGAENLPRKRAMIEASIDLARKLGLDVVAEGVETVEEWRMLSDLGCGVAQGFLVAAPVPADELEDALGHWRRPEC